ncbi:hypothetical protein ACIGXM_08210 [Kitasatospora sp. NPDC052896]|uniref:hypothetical protein n=1 Tax=Kitasatospora sp. NPDC052896 TaxID=3364061 RepID=UPI0037C77717
MPEHREQLMDAEEPPAAADRIATDPLRRALARASRFPSLRHKYAEQLRSTATPTLGRLPVLTRAELVRAVAESGRVRPGTQGANLYAAGGSVAAPWLVAAHGDDTAAEALGSWRPLRRGEVLANLYPAGRLQWAHYFYNALAARSGATVLPFGRLGDDELMQWLDFFRDQRVTALAAPPEALDRILYGCAASGRPLDWLRKVLWHGGGQDLAQLIAERLPEVELWTCYASAEAGVIGHAGPECPPQTFHPLPGRQLEVTADGMILVTVLDEELALPLLRYRTGDFGTTVRCSCGRPELAVRVFRDAARVGVTMHGQPVCPDELAELAEELEEVAAAEVVLTGAGVEPERIRLRVSLRPGVPADDYTREWVRHHVLSRHLVLGGLAAEGTEAFEVVVTG